MVKQYNYKDLAEFYELVETDNEHKKATNVFLEKIFKKYKVKSVADITCGTGAQAIYFSKKGYKVYASDFSKDMLDIARKIAKKQKVNLNFKQGDMRNYKFPKADCVISMYNAIGHLSEEDFIKTLKNINSQLKIGKLYIFDIFNTDFMKQNPVNSFIDAAKEYDNKFFVRFNEDKFNFKKEIINFKEKIYIQEGISQYKMIPHEWDMKVYTIDRLKQLLQQTGFEPIEIYGEPNKKFNKLKSPSIHIVARKIK
ncbi:MAG: class I SAM-dependent methyltransferase [archaeon]|jgi:ubiquinone/menaquinone biosynthesis C-methylase UbiE